MQNTAKNIIKCPEIGTFIINGLRTIKSIPCSKDKNTWNIVDISTIIELDKKELSKANILGCDLDKVLQVKRLILKGLTPTKIRKETGFSRSTVYRYKDLLSAMDTKKPAMNTHSTKTLKSVFPMLLIVNDFALCGTLVILTLLLITVVHSILKRKYKECLDDYFLYKESIKKLHRNLVYVCNYSFKQDPITCNSDKEAAYYRKVLAQYNNKSREVIVLPVGSGENNLNHFDRKDTAKRQYNINNYARIEEGINNYNKYWSKAKKKGYLSYLCYYSNLSSFLYNKNKPLTEERLISKLFLVSVTEFLIENPRPVYKDQAKKKFLLDAIPSITLSIRETQSIKKNELRLKIPKTINL